VCCVPTLVPSPIVVVAFLSNTLRLLNSFLVSYDGGSGGYNSRDKPSSSHRPVFVFPPLFLFRRVFSQRPFPALFRRFRIVCLHLHYLFCIFLPLKAPRHLGTLASASRSFLVCQAYDMLISLRACGHRLHCSL